MPKPGSTNARGYGYEHRQARAKWKPLVEAGQVNCSLCGERILPGQPWDLDHEPGTNQYRGPACRACNRADGGRRRHQPALVRRWTL